MDTFSVLEEAKLDPDVINRILNYTIPDPVPDVTNINLIGPTSITALSNDEYDMRILIFGEVHWYDSNECLDDTKETIRVDEYIEYLINTHSDKRFALFNEEVNTEIIEGYIGLLANKFKNNPLLNYYITYPKITRYLFREYEWIFINTRYFPDYWLSMLKTYEKKYNKKFTNEQLILQMLADDELPFPPSEDTLREVISQMTCIDELDTKLRNSIFDFYMRKIKYILLNHSVSLVDKLTDVVTTIKDINTLTTMFKNNEKNIIIYVGDIHATNLKKFLIHLGFELKYFDENRYEFKQCIDISDMEDIFN